MLKVFDKNLNPTGVLPDADQVQRKRRLNSDYELSFLVPMNSVDYTEKITLKGHVQDERGQYFVINSRKRDRGGLKRMALISCMHVMFKLSDFKMPYDSYIEESFGANILTLTNSISDATGGKFTFVLDDVFELKDVKDFGRGNALQALNHVIKTYGAEVDPNNFVIHLKKKIGVDAGLQYRFKKNIISESYEDDTRTLVTRMYGQMKDGLSIIGLASSNLTTDEYNLLNAVPGAIVNGEIKVNYLISPYWSTWSNSTNTYYDGEIIDQNIEDQLELLEAMRKALREQEVPAIDVSVSAADLHKIDNTEPKPSLGDTVYLIDPDMELNNLSARVVELVEYPFAPDKHSDVNLANFMKRDDFDIIADLDRAKQIVDDITSGAKIRTTVFEAFAKQAIYDINNSKTEVLYDQRGIVLQDKDNAQNLVVHSSKGTYISTDGGVTPRAAITANGVVAEVIVGLLGQFVQLRANQIIVGDNGEKIGDGLLESAVNWNGKTTLITPEGVYTGTVTTNQLVVGSAKISSALIDTIKANQIVVGDAGALIGDSLISGASNWNGKTTLLTPTGIYTGTLNADQINVGVLTGFTINAATINGGTINVDTDINVGSNIFLNGTSATRTIYFGGSGAITADADTIDFSSPNGVTMTGYLFVSGVNILTSLDSKASKNVSTSSAGPFNGGIPIGTQLMVAGGGTVTWAGIAAHAHTQN